VNYILKFAGEARAWAFALLQLYPVGKKKHGKGHNGHIESKGVIRSLRVKKVQ